MRYCYAADIEAIQFTGQNHGDIVAFVQEHCSVEHVSYRHMGRDSPAVFDVVGGLQITVLADEWVLGLDGTLTAVSDKWFRRHCRPVD
jgi:hypothetical protein